MLSLHLPPSPYDIFVLDFPYDFLGIAGIYGLRRKCLHSLRSSCDFRTYVQWTDLDKSYGGCAEIALTSHVSVQSSRSFSKLFTEIIRSSYGTRTSTMQRLYDCTQHFHRKLEVCYTIVAWRPCDARTGIVHCPYDMSTRYGLTIF